MTYLKWLNPLTWSTLALQVVGGVLAAVVLVWYVDGKLDDHYTAKQQEAIKAAKVAADLKIANRQAENDQRTKEALNAKVKTLQANADSAKRADAAAVSLRDDIRASEDRAKTSLTACLQHASAVGGLFVAIDDFAGRVAKEADGHVADKIECTASWPK